MVSFDVKKSEYFSCVVTGATGYIGSMLVKHIKYLNTNAEITVIVRNKNAALSMFSEGVNIIETDLSDSIEMKKICEHFDYIVHCASITKSSEMLNKPVEVISSIVNTTQNVMELAKRCNVKSVVMLSSMEIYGNIDCSDGHRVSEYECGHVELLNVRSCYPIGKRMAENICYSYYKEYGVPVKIARLAQTFGKGVISGENRVFAQFARAVKNKNNIILHTQGNSMGNYCEIEDAINGILTILLNGTDGEAYNVVNEDDTMSIRQMAELVCKEVAHGSITVELNILDDNQYGYAAETGIRLSGQKLRELGWRPQRNLIQMYCDLISEKL